MTTPIREETTNRRARWMAEAQRGDAQAYRALLNDLGPPIMRFLRRRTHSEPEAQDLFQDVFMALHRARHTYEPGRPVEPWLFAIARRVVSRERTRTMARNAQEVLLRSIPERAGESDGFLKVQLEQALHALSPAERQAVELLRVDGLSVEVAAQRAGTTTGALRVRAHRAYRALRRLL